MRKFRYILWVFSLFLLYLWCIPAHSKLFSENLKQQSLSREHAWYLGFSYLPLSEIKAGEMDIQQENEIQWSGTGFSLDSLYVTGFYWRDEESEVFLSLNTSLGYIHWNEKYVWMKDIDNTDTVKKNKGYSVFLFQTIRLNLLIFNMFGVFFKTGLGLSYTRPRNLEINEYVEKGIKPTLQGGMGFCALIPFDNPLIIEIGISLTGIYSDREKKFSNDLFMLKVSMMFEFY